VALPRSRPADGTWLHLYAADLERAPDGRWWLLADRTQAPSGAATRVENREILEQVHPEAIPDMAVRRVRDFFGHLRERCNLPIKSGPPEMSRRSQSSSRLARTRNLFRARLSRAPDGHAVVEGHTSRCGRYGVPQNARGLRRVHSILRRLDATTAIALELRGDSALGGAGPRPMSHACGRMGGQEQPAAD